MNRHYDRTSYYIIGEGFVDGRELYPGGSPHGGTSVATQTNMSSPQVPVPKYKFGRMFNLPPYRPNPASLVELGKAMSAKPATNARSADDPSWDSNIPAGYTYLGQFIAHEITFDTSKGLPEVLPESVTDIDSLEQGRTPSLDLDSLYGTEEVRSYLFEEDGIRLRVGKTEKDPFPIDPIQNSYYNDLPRRVDLPPGISDRPSKPQEALIGDPRNDENLALAQTHVAFIRFHNAVVDYLMKEKGFPADDVLLSVARKMVIQHFQSIVLQDYLPRIVDEEILASAIARKDAPEFFKVGRGQEPFMPVEFSAAAFRIGHSMIRAKYN